MNCSGLRCDFWEHRVVFLRVDILIDCRSLINLFLKDYLLINTHTNSPQIALGNSNNDSYFEVREVTGWKCSFMFWEIFFIVWKSIQVDVFMTFSLLHMISCPTLKKRYVFRVSETPVIVSTMFFFFFYVCKSCTKKRDDNILQCYLSICLLLKGEIRDEFWNHYYSFYM